MLKIRSLIELNVMDLEEFKENTDPNGKKK